MLSKSALNKEKVLRLSVKQSERDKLIALTENISAHIGRVSQGYVIEKGLEILNNSGFPDLTVSYDDNDSFIDIGIRFSNNTYTKLKDYGDKNLRSISNTVRYIINGYTEYYNYNELWKC